VWIYRDCPRGVTRGGQNVQKGAKMANVWIYVLNYWETVENRWVHAAMHWQALNPLSIHVTFTAIVPVAYPGTHFPFAIAIRLVLTCVSHTAHVIDIGWTSVRYTLVLCRNVKTIVKLSSLLGSSMTLVFWGPNFFPEFQWKHPQRGR